MVLDLTQNEDKIRLRVGDYNEPLLLPTSVYTATLADNNNNVNKCVPIIATYLLALFAQKTHSKLSYIEVWGSEGYNNYKDWLLKVVLNPMLNQSSPIPYTGASSTDTKSPLIQFVNDWDNAYQHPHQSDDLHTLAEGTSL
jgi:hypothetical protein